jgi:hypothetical protein
MSNSELESLPGSRGSSGRIVSGYGLDDRGSIPEQRRRIFLLASASKPAHPDSCPMSTRGPFSRGKARPGRDADYLPPSSAEVKNE